MGGRLHDGPTRPRPPQTPTSTESADNHLRVLFDAGSSPSPRHIHVVRYCLPSAVTPSPLSTRRREALGLRVLNLALADRLRLPHDDAATLDATVTRLRERLDRLTWVSPSPGDLIVARRLRTRRVHKSGELATTITEAAARERCTTRAHHGLRWLIRVVPGGRSVALLPGYQAPAGSCRARGRET